MISRALFILCLLLAGCGQKGDLYIPDATNPEENGQVAGEDQNEKPKKA